MVQISQASPAWEDYVDYIDALVLDGLLHSARVSLRNMLNHIVRSSLCDVSFHAHLLLLLLSFFVLTHCNKSKQVSSS